MMPTVRSRCQTFLFTRPRFAEPPKLCAVLPTARSSKCLDASLSAHRAERARQLPRRRSSPRPARRRDGREDHGAVGAAAPRRRRGGSALPHLRPRRRSRHRRPARLRRGARGPGQDLARLVHDLLEHLRHLLLVQHTGEVPDSLPVTPETRERLRSQANQLGEPEVLRLIDLLAVAVEDVRQGGDPRLPLELALVKVTRPGADLSRESLSYRIEQLESRARGANEPRTERADEPPAPTPPPAPRDLDLEQLRARGNRPSCRPSRAAPFPRRRFSPREAGGARRRAPRRRVSPGRVVPPQPRGGAEERRASRRGALRGDGPPARRRLRAAKRARSPQRRRLQRKRRSSRS